MLKNILFVSWDGPQTNYIESLFLPIFKKVAEESDFHFHIMQFTWGDKEKIRKTKTLCEVNSISYTAVPVYRKNPILGLLKAVFFQSSQIRNYIKENDIRIVMPRATTSAWLVNRLHLVKVSNLDKVKVVFDADGFSQDERADFGEWSRKGLRYKLYRKQEKKALLIADAVICRSQAAKEILTKRSGNPAIEEKITVIANGRDIRQFNITTKEKKPSTAGVKFIYAGSLGPQYCLPQMLEIFNTVYKKNSESEFLILTGDKVFAEEQLKQYKELRETINIKRVPHHEVPVYIGKADIAFALRKPGFSMKGVCPIKLGEYLLCGIPVIATKGIGDTEKMLKDKDCAFLIEDKDALPLDKIADWCEKVRDEDALKAEARAIGLKYFDLEKTVEKYIKVLKDVC